MASTSKDVPTTIIEEHPPDDLEPGACHDSILNPTDSFEEFASEMSSSLQERNISLSAINSTIIEIQSEIGENSAQIKATKSSDDLQNKDVSFSFFVIYFTCYPACFLHVFFLNIYFKIF